MSYKNRDMIRPYGERGVCEFCHKLHSSTFGSGRFCSRKCQRAWLAALHGTPEWKAKVRAKMIDRPHPWAEVPCPLERRAKISAAHKRIKQPGSSLLLHMSRVMTQKLQDPEYRARMTRIHQTPEFRAKMSLVVKTWRAKKRHEKEVHTSNGPADMREPKVSEGVHRGA